ncbi:MAG: ATP-binding protein [Zavarzinella sp.]
MPRLIVIGGPDEGRQFELPANAEITLGRERTNSIVLHDTEVSRHHALITFVAPHYRVKDLKSSNGTLLNNRTVQDAPLSSGDELTLGQSVLMFTYDQPAGRQTREDLTEKVRLVPKKEGDIPSAIIKTVAADEGSRILTRPEAQATDWLKTRLANLAVLYETSQAISHISDLGEMMQRLLELLLDSIPADQGCIMQIDLKDKSYQPTAVRFRDQNQMLPSMNVSKTIVDWVIQQQQGVLISNAARDSRFATGKSITRYNINEVICVPMQGRHETHGVLFLDTVTDVRKYVQQNQAEPTASFKEDHLSLAIAIAHQIALAIEGTRYYQAMLQAERLAAVGQAMAAVSHHVKNIMQGIVFGSDMVNTALREQDGELMGKGWNLVQKNQQRIQQLVLDMLTFSKEREPNIIPEDLNLLVQDVMELVRGRIDDYGIRLEMRLSATLPHVPCDADGVHNAILNVVSNAIDALEHSEDKFLAIQTLVDPTGEWAKVIVLDHGPGIPEATLREIFQPFVSTKGAKGTGLGLAVCRKIFREHGGEVVAESIVGKGSKFTMRLPLKSPFGPDPNQGTAHELPLFPTQVE